MTRSGEHERRPFYACESCSVVYARVSPPDGCRICDDDRFVEVMPIEYEY